jgi:release factor glutamine methyltransferase
VANLPYISVDDMQKLSREVQCDPELALAGGQKGTELMQRFLVECQEYLNSGGKIAMEFGFQQAGPLKTIASGLGLKNIEIKSDDSGHERFLFAEASD